MHALTALFKVSWYAFTDSDGVGVWCQGPAYSAVSVLKNALASVKIVPPKPPLTAFECGCIVYEAMDANSCVNAILF